jgi:hypothetical protein
MDLNELIATFVIILFACQRAGFAKIVPGNSAFLIAVA